MEEKIKLQLKINKIREMKNPTILMNSNDYETFKKELEAKVGGLKTGDNPKFEGVPIKINSLLEQGNIVVYDDPSPLLTNQVRIQP